MSRINTNVQSLIAQRVLQQNNQALNLSLERLSTGLRINRGKDDPAGLIASENLRSEMRSVNAAIANAERAEQVVNIAEGGLQEISGLLTELQGLITTTANTAGLSAEEREANQLQIDSILQTIDRVAASTSFQGMRLLNGNFDYQVNNVHAGVTDFNIAGAKLTQGQNIDVDVIITQSAQQAGLWLAVAGVGSNTINLNGGVNSAFTIEISGSLGSRQLQFASGASVTDMITAINTFSDVTGVKAVASAGAGHGLRLESTKFGSSHFVSVAVNNAADIQGADTGIYHLASDNFNVADGSAITFDSGTAKNGVRDEGQNLAATINGIAATADGKTARINTDFLNVQVTFDSDTAQTLGQVSAFSITGGGADFQLAGQVDIGGKVSIGIQDVAVRKLGNSEFGFLSELSSGKDFNVVNGNLTKAQEVVGEAIQQVSAMRGRLGAFQQNTVGATIRSLGITLENTTAAESVIRDTDFASEVAQLTRAQILASSSTNILGLANAQPQAVLGLLG